MSNSQLIYEYLDSGLDQTKEDILFKELYENKEYRDEFFSMVKYEGAASFSFANTQVPLSSTNAIFSNLGISLPTAEVVVVENDRHLVGFFASIGSMALFTHFKDYVSAFLGLLIGGLLTAFIYNLTGNNESNFDESSNNLNNSSIVVQKKDNKNDNPPAVNERINSQFKNRNLNPNTIQNRNMNSLIPSNQRIYNNHLNNKNDDQTNRLSVSNNNSINLNPNDINYNNLNSKIDFNQFSSLNLTEDIIKNLGVIILDNNNLENNLMIDSTSNNLTVFNVNNYYNINNENLNSQLNIINSLTEQTKEELFRDNIYYVDNQVYEDAKDFNDFTLNFSGIGFTQNNYNNQVIDFSNNIRLGLLYTVANNHSMGIEVGNEQFILPNQLDMYQLKNTYFIGANYKYEVKELSLFRGVYPSIGTSVNFATIGTIARVNLGLNLKPENRLSFGIFYEPSILFNNYKDLGINYSKNNIIIGISYKLE